jgi:hypothetical protein
MSSIAQNRKTGPNSVENELLAKTCISLHYTLQFAVSNSHDSLMFLYLHAQRLFPQTSRIFALTGSECRVQGETDLLADMKLHAQMLLMNDERLVSVYPQELRAFACETPTGQIAYFGFAKYAQQTEILGKSYRIHDGRNVFWRGFVRLENSRHARTEVLATIGTFSSYMRYVEQGGLLREFQIA